MTNKTVAKRIAKVTKQATPAKTAAVVTPITYDAKAAKLAIMADFRACMGEVKAGQTAYTACTAMIKAAPLSSPTALAMFRKDLAIVFANYPDKLALRNTLLSNAVKVAHGGVKNKHVVAGRGIAALDEAMDKVKSLRDLRVALVDAKPVGLKEVTAATGDKAKSAKKSDAKNLAQKPSDVNTQAMPTDKPSALQAACKVLRFCESFFQPGADARLLGHLELVIKALQEEEAKLHGRNVKQEEAKQSKAA